MASENDPIPPLPKPAPFVSAHPRSTSPFSQSGSVSGSESDRQTFHDAAAHFSPAEEASLLSESNIIKSEANSLFSQKRYSEAISTYDRALASCPNYLDYEVAVLKSNVSACHVQLEEWKAAVDSATEALEGLDRLSPLDPDDNNDDKDKSGSNTGGRETDSGERRKGLDNQKPTKFGRKANQANDGGDDKAHADAVVVEIPSDEDESTALHRLSLSDARRADITRIRIKSLLRRARARHKEQTWSSLAGAQEDYKLLLSLMTSSPSSSSSSGGGSSNSSSSSRDRPSASDLATVKSALSVLPAQLNSAKEKEMGEMMGKLKDLGNGILKPFGLSTDNFKMVQDQKTGGYSMNFEGGGSK